jgi:hypothetical protein
MIQNDIGKYWRLILPKWFQNSPNKIRQISTGARLIIRGEARYEWLHGIAWRKTDCVDEGSSVETPFSRPKVTRK